MDRKTCRITNKRHGGENFLNLEIQINLIFRCIHCQLSGKVPVARHPADNLLVRDEVADPHFLKAVLAFGVRPLVFLKKFSTEENDSKGQNHDLNMHM